MTYHFPMFPRLKPRTPFQGGRIADTDVLNLTEAARFASVHAGAEITCSDFLRAAGRGEITMQAIVHQTAKLQKIGGGVYCNAGQPNENTVPTESRPTLPLSACQQLAATGRASWRKFDGFEEIDGQLMRYVIAELTPDEPDFETTPDDCLFTGYNVRALADEYLLAPAQTAATPAPTGAETTEERRARWLDWYGKGERGAVQRVYERELQLNPKADRSFIGKEINKAKKEKAEIKRGGFMFGQLVQDGKRMG